MDYVKPAIVNKGATPGANATSVCGNASKRVLGLPVDNAWATWSAVIITFIYYFYSKFPDLSVWDSPLIAMVAIQGGLGHPPGYPLHTLLGFVLSHLPGIDPLTGVKLLSIIPGALMCIPVISIASRMTYGAIGKRVWYSSWLTAAFANLLCLHPVLWGPSTRVEVYSLAAFLATWGVARLGAAMEDRSTLASSRQTHGKGFYITGLAFGTSAAVNPVVAAATAAATFTPILDIIFRGSERWRSMIKILAGGSTGLLLYAWVPIAGGFTDRLVWGDPTSASAIWNFLRARDYAGNVGPTAADFLSQGFEWIGWAVKSGTLLFVVLGMVGWFLLGKRSRLGRSGPIALVFAILAICNNKVWLPENPDYLGYLCGPVSICAAGGAALLSYLVTQKGVKIRIFAWTCLSIAVLVTLFSPPAIYSRTRHLDRSARLQAMGALKATPQNGILIIGSDHLLWPMMYIQEVENVRSDVVILTPGLVNSSWYWNHTYRLHPDLHPFIVNGPGGRYGRLHRFILAQKNRRLGFESVSLAHRLGVSIHGVGWLLRDRAVDIKVTEKATAAIEKAAAVIGTGSYNGVGTLALASYIRGNALWRLGQPEEAYRAFLAGVPPSMRPAKIPPSHHWEKVPPLRIPIPQGTSTMKGLGEPHQNLSIARYLIDPEKIKELEKLQSTHSHEP